MKRRDGPSSENARGLVRLSFGQGMSERGGGDEAGGGGGKGDRALLTSESTQKEGVESK